MGCIKNLLALFIFAFLFLSSPREVFAEEPEVPAEVVEVPTEIPAEVPAEIPVEVPAEEPKVPAEVKEIPAEGDYSAEGEYRLGDRDTREAAKNYALADAKRKIIEQIGVFVASYTEVNNVILTKDEIRTAANAVIRIKHEEVHFYDEGTLCRAFVVANIDRKAMKDILDGKKNPEPTPQPPPQNDDHEKFLKLAVIDEYNGHYYKVFNEPANWRKAKKRCEEMGGYLVAINTREEQAFVQQILFLHGEKPYYWIGGTRVGENEWHWLNGEKFSYTNWNRGEPNNAGGVEDVIAIVKSVGTWTDLANEGFSIRKNNRLNFYVDNIGFVCEWDSFESIKEAY